MGLSASKSSIWSSDSSVHSLHSRGAARLLSLIVSAFGTGSSSHTLSYEAPSLSSATSNLPSSGSVFVSIFGLSFSVGSSAGVKVGACAVSVYRWFSDSSMNIKCVPGTSSRLAVVVSIVNQLGVIHDALSFDKPAPSKLNSTLPASGSFLVWVLASNMGKGAMSISVRLKMTAVESTVWFQSWTCHT